MTKPCVLVVDDDPALGRSLVRALTHYGFEVQLANSGQGALDALDRRRFDVLIIDLRMPGMDGLDVLRRASSHPNFPPTILHSAYLDVRTTVEAMRAGAIEVIEKPASASELAQRIRALAAFSSQAPPPLAPADSAVHAQVEEPPLGDDSSEGTLLLGRSPPMQSLRGALRRISRFRDLAILIEGDTGTGKELVAQTIHQLSAPDEPMVSVNCAAIPAELFESELFGHDPGAFTSARGARAGLFEEAGSGTLFLDEVGELPYALQPKLLRVLETREFRRVGSNRVRRFNARVVSATNRRLGEAENRTFRSDLYFRISGHTLRTPALRERRADIPLLAMHFCRRFCEQHSAGAVSIADDAMDALYTYDWPGNARQLRVVVENAVVHAGGLVIRRAEIDSALFYATATRDGFDSREMVARSASRQLPELEREMILDAYRGAGQNLTRAADVLGIPRTTLRDRLKRYGVR